MLTCICIDFFKRKHCHLSHEDEHKESIAVLLSSAQKYLSTIFNIVLLYLHYQYEAALAVDAVTVIGKALSKMITRDPDIFKLTFRNGKIYNNNTEGIDCDAEPVIPWKHGYDIMKTMREVNIVMDKCFICQWYYLQKCIVVVQVIGRGAATRN